MIKFLLVISMTLCGSVASLFLSKVSKKQNLKEIIFSIDIYMGGFLYLLASILTILLLKISKLSFVSPMTTITYIWTLFLSKYFLKEQITKNKVIALLFIISGVLVITLL